MTRHDLPPDLRPMALDVSQMGRWTGWLSYRAGLLSPEVLAALTADRAEQGAVTRAQTRSGSSIAVVGLQGPIVRRPDFFDEFFGAASLERFMGSVRAAAADPDVTAILLDVDSPGGEVAGLTEAAAELRAIRAQKPLGAIADTMAASAAYWLASQASDLTVTPSGGVGAIGIYSIHDDFTAALEQAGIKRTIISAGKFKEASIGGLALSDAARKQWQDIADADYAAFTSDVAKGRGIPVKTVRSGYGQGLYLGADAALAEGMVDRVATLGEAIRSPKLKSLAASTALLDDGGDQPDPLTELPVQDEPPTGDPPVVDPPQIEPIEEPDQAPLASLDYYRARARRHLHA